MCEFFILKSKRRSTPLNCGIAAFISSVVAPPICAKAIAAIPFSILTKTGTPSCTLVMLPKGDM